MSKTKLQRIQFRVFELMEPGLGNDRASRAVDIFLIFVILTALVATVMESVEPLAVAYGSYFHRFEQFCVALFSLEYLLRLWTSPVKLPGASPARSRLRYILSFYGLIDLVAILPFYFSFLVPGLDLRILRLVRVLRILKISHYNSALQDLWSAIYDERKSFISAIYIFSIALFLCSTLAYFAESSAQPDKFSSIPQAMWWGIITLTTVGYGDVSPVTLLGKIIGVATALLGVCTVALLTGIVANSFSSQMARKRAIFEAAILRALEDGTVSSEEKDVINRMRDEFNLTREHADAIFAKALQEHRSRQLEHDHTVVPHPDESSTP